MQNDRLKVKKTKPYEIDGDVGKAIWKEEQGIIFCDAVTGKKIEKNQARAKMSWSEEGLYILYNVDDAHIWGTYKNDNDPIYNEEVVEIFIGASKDVPKKYYEFQFSPLGVKFDAKIANPTGNRHEKGFNVNIGWDCEGLKFAQKFEIKSKNINFKTGRWITEAFIPWRSIGVKSVKSGDIFRANLFCIDGYPKQISFQAWQPTFEDPPNFHVPEKFGYIELI